MSDIEDLREKWKVKHQRIDKEDRKRFFALFLFVILNIITLLLFIVDKIDIITQLIMILGFLGIFQIYNWIIYKRIRRIIWEDTEDLFKL